MFRVFKLMMVVTTSAAHHADHRLAAQRLTTRMSPGFTKKRVPLLGSRAGRIRCVRRLPAGAFGLSRLLYRGSIHVSEQKEVLEVYFQSVIQIEIRVPSFTGLRQPEHIREQEEVPQVDPSAAVEIGPACR